MQIEVTPADDAYDIVQKLARFYLYDMAEHAGFDFSAEGDLDPGNFFASYWGRPGGREWPSEWRGFPFLLRIEGKPAGFALVKRMQEEPARYDMGEFFVARPYRRHNAGRAMATLLFDRFPGQWEVREMTTNVNAQAFWRQIIADYTKGDFTDNREVFPLYGDREFVVQRFQSGRDR